MTFQERLRHVSAMRFWLAPGMGVKRHVAVVVLGTMLMVTGAISWVLWALQGERERFSAPIETVLVSDTWSRYGALVSLAALLVGLVVATVAIGRLNRSLLANWMPRPHEAARVLHERLQLSRGPAIVALGGGTGLSNLLRGLRRHTSNLTAVVAVSDDGGSSGRLRDEFGMPAPGDLSDCLAALSDNEIEVSRLLQYRFVRGRELRGHTFGNLFITTLTEVEGDFAAAIRALNRLLNLEGSVYPMTAAPVRLRAVKRDGSVVEGESRLRDGPGPVERVELEPADVPALPEVVEAIRRADVVVLGPGSLFTSTLPPLLVPQVRRALRETKAEILYVCNIMTEAGETDGMDAFEHVEALYRHLGRYPSRVAVNRTPVDDARLQAYAAEGASRVGFDPAPFESRGIAVDQAPLLGGGSYAQHDSAELARWLAALARRGTIRA